MNKYILFNIFLFVWINFLNAQSNYEFDGQVLGQTNIGFGKEGTKFLGTRYIPEFTFDKEIDSLSSFAIETLLSPFFKLPPFIKSTSGSQGHRSLSSTHLLHIF